MSIYFAPNRKSNPFDVTGKCDRRADGKCAGKESYVGNCDLENGPSQADVDYQGPHVLCEFHEEQMYNEIDAEQAQPCKHGIDGRDTCADCFIEGMQALEDRDITPEAIALALKGMDCNG